jgi:hypothetical protein
MIKNIIFYNHAHNGDIFLSKGYVSHIIKNLPNINFAYAHEKSDKVLRDLKIGHINVHGVAEMYEKYSLLDETLYINTWVGNYLHYGDCNWKTLHLMYSDIINFINNYIDYKIELMTLEQYCPTIDFSFYDIPKNFDLDFEETIIFSNGPVLSGQSNIINMDQIINEILNVFPNRKIILTHHSNIQNDRIIYSSSIIQSNDTDLNEIAWLSTKCKYIIGRQSGPFIFMQIPENINDSRKKIICFGINETTDWLYKINIKANYNMFIETNCEIVETIIEALNHD